MAEIVYQVVRKPIDERLIDAACVYWNVERSYFMNKENEKDSSEVSYRKKILFYLIKINCPAIGVRPISKKFGEKSQTNVHRAIEEVSAAINVYKQYKTDVNQIAYLADKMDADFITVPIFLQTKTEQNGVHNFTV